MEIKIRKAVLADAETIAGFNQRMAMETENRVLDSELIVPGVTAVLNDPEKGHYYIADSEGVSVGCLLITFEWSDWRNAPMWWFQSVFVAPEARGKKVFGQMYQFVMDQARKNGVKELRLYVEKENSNAQKIYEKLGMEQSHYLMYEVVVE